MREFAESLDAASSAVLERSATGIRSSEGRRKAIRVAFVGQAGTAGGAERTLATHLSHAPPDLAATVILFEPGLFADELRGLGIPVEVLAVPVSIATSRRERLRLSAPFDAFGFAVRLARLIRQLKTDVVYSYTLKAHLVCALAARLAGVPCVMDFQDLVEGKMLQALRFMARIGSVERVACARIVADTIALKRTTVCYGPIVLESYRTMPGRDETRDRLGLPKDIPVVGLVGRINRWKGHDRLLRIAADINRVTPVHFAIVGAPIFRDADFVPELKELVRQLGIEDRVTFIPWIDNILSVYAALDVNVNCSTREPFGRTVAEAAGAGVPSVCFDDSGAAETILNRCTGRVVPAGDEAAFARAILDCLATAGDPETRALVRYGARRFDAQVAAEEIAAVIRRAARIRTANPAQRTNAAFAGKG